MTRALRRLAALLLACALLAPASPARAGIADAPGEALEIALVTYGPGTIYWERFGHDAIEVRDTVGGEAVAFNYGVFDFEQRDFLLNFARGYMIYRMDAVPAAEDAAYYATEGRRVTRQTLALTPPQRAALRDFLLWNVQPAHTQYRYDYFTDNCTTRVRDALDRALGGAIRRQTQAPSHGFTYRMHTDRLLAAQPALMLLVDLGLGPAADRRLSYWDESFVPMVLMRVLREVQLPDGRGGTQPLVAHEAQLDAGRLPAPPGLPPDLRLPFLLAALLLGSGLAWAGHHAPRRHAARLAFAWGGALYALAAGLAGLFMALLWTATAHRYAWANENLLLFSPLALLLVPALLRLARADARSGRFARALAALLLLTAGFALFAKILPWFVQQNLAWIELGLALNLALAYGLWRHR
ncbi:MAG: DUF4105 domain-containing protein [Mizugakiibacter sp.]|uniref:lipoprotein N-acyltransferase Lnb domain-containing protein n=1 Tax=Mizugakiibacter sp. TaxID=1972610 RepID=UPI0031BF337D|nr:DUF4105 domain-containing protein [Xanthomonadaceae bacterium]